MTTSRFCRACHHFHDLAEDWPESCYGHFVKRETQSGIQIIKDIDPYKTVAADVNGRPARIGSRREHREFLKRNNYVEIGNEPIGRRPTLSDKDFVSHRDVKAAYDQVRRNR